MLFDSLRYFLEVSKYSSLNNAAEKLFISPQALGKSLRHFEEEVGLTLCTRSHQGIALTDDGERILEDVKKILEIVDSWDNLSEEKRHSISGNITCVILPQLGRVIATCIGTLNDRYPAINISYFHQRGLAILDSFSRHQASIGVFMMDNMLHQSALQTFSTDHHLAFELVPNNENVCLCINRNHPLASQANISLQDCAFFSLASLYNETPIFETDHLQFFSQKKRFLCHNYNDIFSLISSSNSIIAFVPHHTFEHFSPTYPLLKALDIEQFNRSSPFVILHPDDAHINQAEKIIVQAIKEQLCYCYGSCSTSPKQIEQP